jgi:hypothetical protein
MDPAVVSPLELGRDAFKRHAWTEALEAFAAADRDGVLSPADLEQMGEAAWWAGRPDEATDPLERAFAAYVEAGRPTEAAGVAFHLSYVAFRRQAPSVGGGWLGRAAGLLENLPESGMHAWLHLFAAIGAAMDNRMLDGLAMVDRAIAVARQHRNADVQFMATSFKGYGEVHQGNVQVGLALIDEAAAAATSGQLDLRIASDILCNTIAACRNIGDLKRAGEWADEGERWMRRQTVGGYPGICRVHRAELKMLRGQWPEAELEARQACEELQRFGLYDSVGFAYHEIGEIRLRMGDLQGRPMPSSGRTSSAMTGSPASRSSIWRAARMRTPGVRSSGRSPRHSRAKVRWTRPPAHVSCQRRSTSRSPGATWRPRARPSKSSRRSRPGTSDRCSRRAR